MDHLRRALVRNRFTHAPFVAAVERVTLPSRPTSTTAPTVIGDPIVGQDLTADDGTWTGTPGTTEHAWLRCDHAGNHCVTIDDAQDPAYTVHRGDADHTIRTTVTATALGSSQRATATSDATTPVAAGGAPVNVEAPTVSGVASERETLTASPGTWSGSSITYHYQWQACDEDGLGCDDIVDATQTTYVPSQDHLERRIRVIVTAHNANADATAASALTDPVIVGPAPVSEQPPSLTLLGTSGPGSTLVTDGGRFAHVDPDTREYQWQRCDTVGQACADSPTRTTRPTTSPTTTSATSSGSPSAW